MEVTTVVEDVGTGAINSQIPEGDWLGSAVFGFLTAVGACGTTSEAGRCVL